MHSQLSKPLLTDGGEWKEKSLSRAGTTQSTVASVNCLVQEWHCHCCTAKNSRIQAKCRVCGRPESYAMEGYHLPFHGNNATLYRPSQILTVLDDIHETDEEGWTALHSACSHGNLPIVKELLMLKAKVEAITKKGQRPLHLAVYSGSLPCVETLIKFNAHVDATTFHEKSTPLHMACQAGYAQIASVLIQNGADIEACNILKRTPLHLAAMSGRVDIGNLLLRRGAKNNPLDLHQWDPRQLAELFQHKDFQDMLIRERMTEKQAVIKEVPHAEWHSDVWSQVVRMRAQRSADYQRSMAQQTKEDDHMARLKELRIAENKQHLREERQQELARFHEYKRMMQAKKENSKYSRYSSRRILAQELTDPNQSQDLSIENTSSDI